MTVSFFVGILIGVSVAAPVGPVALLILRRSLNEGRLAGFVSGLGAASADFVCGLAATVSLAWVTQAITAHRFALQVVGGVALLVMGVRTFRAGDPSAAKRPVHERALFFAFLFTMILTLSNPLTWLGMLAVVAAAGVGGPEYGYSHTAVLCTGIFLGSGAWWLLLTAAAGWLGRKLGNRLLHVLNMVAGGIITLFGALQLASAAKALFTKTV